MSKKTAGSLGNISDVFFSPEEILEKGVIVSDDFQEMAEGDFGLEEYGEGDFDEKTEPGLSIDQLTTDTLDMSDMNDEGFADFPALETEEMPSDASDIIGLVNAESLDQQPSLENRLALSVQQVERLRKRIAIKALAAMNWKLSENKKRRWNAAELELRVDKQRNFDRDIRMIQLRHEWIGSTLEAPCMPRSITSINGLKRRISVQEDATDVTQDEQIKELRKKAIVIGWRPKAGMPLAELREKLAEQFVLHDEYRLLESKAEEIEFEAFEPLPIPYERQAIDELAELLDQQDNYSELGKISTETKGKMAWAPDLPESPYSQLAVSKYKTIVKKQLKYHNKISHLLDKLPERAHTDLTLPRPPYTSDICEEALGQIQQALVIEEGRQKRISRIYRLIRLGIVLAVVLFLSFWEIRLISDVADLNLRSASLRLSLPEMSFPYTPWQVQQRREFVEKQEALAPYFDALIADGATKQLILTDLPKPYTKAMLHRWKNALNDFEFVHVPAGEFTMGDQHSTDEDIAQDSIPAHPVTLTRPFYMQKTEVTQALYEAIMLRNPSSQQESCERCPVDNINWLDAIKFANRMSQFAKVEPCYKIKGDVVTWPQGLNCNGYRLPTEAEWEYAARSKNSFPYAGGYDVGKVAWVEPHSKQKMQAVGQLQANAFGIQDMTGSVWEWCWDYYSSYSSPAKSDPIGPTLGSERIKRGGDFRHSVVTVHRRSSLNASANEVGVGFRLVRTIK